MTSRKLNFVEVTLDAPLNSGDATFNVTTSKKNRKGVDSSGLAQYYDLGPSGGIFKTQFRATIKEKGGSRVEVLAISGVAHNGQTSDDNRNKYTLTVEIADDASTKLRGLDQDDDGTNAVGNVITDNIVSQFAQGSTLLIAWDTSEQNRLEALFDAGTVTAQAEAGEGATVRNTASLKSDGKLYKYNSSTAPNLVGIFNATVLITETATYTTFGGLSTGHTGLTIGANQYAENTGAITETPSATTTLIGVAETATTIRVVKVGDSAVELSQAEVENSSSTVFGLVSGLRLSQSIIANAITEFLTTVFRIQDNTDNTKEIAFDASGITTGNVRTIAMPDSDVDLGALSTGKLVSKVLQTVSNTSTETTLLTYTLAADALDTDNVVSFKVPIISGNFDNGTATFKLKYGTTTVSTLTMTTVGNMEGVVNFSIMNAGSTSSQRGEIDFVREGNSSAFSFNKATGTASEDSTTALTMEITVQFSVSGATQNMTAYNMTSNILR